jgi:hypothetical protein
MKYDWKKILVEKSVKRRMKERNVRRRIMVKTSIVQSSLDMYILIYVGQCGFLVEPPRCGVVSAGRWSM